MALFVHSLYLYQIRGASLIRYAQRLDTIPPSPTLAISSAAKKLKAAGYDVVPFASGEPDFSPFPHVIEAAEKAIADGHNGYIATVGLQSLREAIADEYKKRGRTVNPSSVIVTVGAKQALYNAAQVLFQKGDRVLIPAPYWVSYPAIVSLSGAEPVVIEPDEELKIGPDALREKLDQDPEISGIILCSPSNPTGVVYQKEELAALGAVLRDYPKVWVLFDAIYDRLSYLSSIAADFVASCPDLEDRVVTFNGFSKAYAMTGWRLGYAIAPPEVIRRMTILQSQSTSNAVTFVQYAGVAALLTSETLMEEQRVLYQKRRDALCDALDSFDGIKFRRPAGAFYLFADFSAFIGADRPFRNGEEFSQKLLDEVYVATVHGEAFGRPGFVRLTYTHPVEVIQEGVNRIGKFLGDHA